MPVVPRLPLTLAILAAAVLTACGSGSPSPSAAPTPSPTASPGAPPSAMPFTAPQFATDIPIGWTNRTNDPSTYSQVVPSGMGTGLLVLQHDVPGTFQSGVNDVRGVIVVVQLADPVPDDQLKGFAGQSRKGVSDLSDPVTLPVDAVTAYEVTYKRDLDGTPGQTDEVLVNFQSQTYDIFLSTSQYAFSGQQKDFHALLQDWHWRA